MAGLCRWPLAWMPRRSRVPWQDKRLVVLVIRIGRRREVYRR